MTINAEKVRSDEKNFSPDKIFCRTFRIIRPPVFSTMSRDCHRDAVRGWKHQRRPAPGHSDGQREAIQKGLGWRLNVREIKNYSDEHEGQNNPQSNENNFDNLVVFHFSLRLLTFAFLLS